MSRLTLAWRRRLLFCGFVVGASSLVACGGRTPIDMQSFDYDDAGSPGDAGPDIQYDVLPDSAKCNPSTCPTGCCTPSGDCLAGTAGEACGAGGYLCVDCTQYGASCDPAKHQCTGFVPCSASSCPNGCCQDTYTCRSGTEGAYCGKGGQACKNCEASGLMCGIASQSCEASKCGPATCSGCCDQNGKCVSGSEPVACGLGGGKCMDCASQGLSCVGGACQSSACGPANCPFGCCDPATAMCMKGVEQYACGAGGQTCTACSFSQTCQVSNSGGQCTSTPSCNPSNCSWGCCDFSVYPPMCVPGTNPWQCGSGGSLCQPCAAPDQQCVGVYNGGMCSTMGECSPKTCAFGCCDPNTWPMQCVKGYDTYACGSGGQICQYCAPGQQCQPGTNGGYCGGSTDCNPSTCPWGCCDPNTWPMQCVSGMEPWSCGSNGQKCQPCAAPGQQCVPSYSGGMCISSGQCDPSTCPGCCDFNVYPPMCVGGSEPWACGLGGVACQQCGPNQKCNLGKCSGGGGCGPGNCSGCCDYNSWPAACAPGQSPSSCGVGGNACVTCPWGSTCQNGQCVTAPLCGPDNCVGCCDNSVYPPKCVKGLEPQYCGSGGQSCKVCAPDQMCVMSSSGGGTCQSGALCGPSTCSGCCDFNGVCRSGDTNTSCGIKGGACSNCLATNTICDPANGTCVFVPNCGPYNCAGCCTKTGVCQPGYVSPECGHGGVLCENCLNTGTTCQNGACSGGSSSSCPVSYPGCSPAANIPQPLTLLNSCSPIDLKNALVNCGGSTTPPSCGVWFNQLQFSSPACYKCLLPFTGPKAFGTCLAPYLDPGCNHDLACSLDCQAVACGQCTQAELSACQQSVWSSACGGYLQGLYCAEAAMQGPGSFCSPTGDYGVWLNTVGNHYCGTGTP